MNKLMEKMEQNKDQRIMTLGCLRSTIKDLEERFDGDELDYQILEYVTVYLYHDFGFAGWWLRNRAYWDKFLAEAQRQERAGGYPEDAEQRAFWDTLTIDVIDYLSE